MRDGLYLYHKSLGSVLMLYRTNRDLDPVPRHLRKWGVTSFISYWISDAFKYEPQ
jgi:cytosine/uracil/thiamine/allantoin permease